MEIISPEFGVDGSLEKGEDEGCQCPLLDVIQAKASLTHSPVQGLFLGLLKHVGVYEGFGLAGEILHILNSGIDHIASVVQFAICETVDTMGSEVHWHKSSTFPRTNSVPHPFF